MNVRGLVFAVLSGGILQVLAFAYGSDTRQGADSKRFVGSASCLECHKEHYTGWKKTLHAKMEQTPAWHGPQKNVLGDFSIGDEDLTFKTDDVNMIIGNRFKQRYAKKIGDDYYLLRAQWNVKSKEWVPYFAKQDWWAYEGIYPEEWDKRPASRLCRGCHNTGFDVTTKTPAEENIACESCHGPGSLHVENEGQGHITNPRKLRHEVANMVCFQCHMSGRPPKGEFEKYAWPVGYRPGENLRAFWVYDQPRGKNSYELWAGGYAHKNRVQGNTFVQSAMYRKGISCFTCHDSHGTRFRSFTIRSGDSNALCLSCHQAEGLNAAYKVSITQHTHHKEESAGSNCVECHMPKTGMNAVKWDSRDHTFRFVSPLETLKFGTPNACTNCHKDRTPEWAYETLSQWRFIRFGEL